MSDNNNSTGPVAIGFPGLLAIVFITLKLCGAIDWSWWYVTMPLWIVPAILLISAFFFLLLSGITILVVAMLEELNGK